MQLEDMYQEIILDHYRNPHHKGLRDPFDAEVYQVNPTCGDEVKLRVTLKPGVDGEAVVEDVSYDSLGCSISQASASVMSDLVIGKPVSEAMRIGDAFLELMQSKGQGEPDEDVLEDAVAFAGVSKYPARIKCALLGWMAWKAATAQASGQASRSDQRWQLTQERGDRHDRAGTPRLAPFPRSPTNRSSRRPRTFSRRCATWWTPSSASTWLTSAWSTASMLDGPERIATIDMTLTSAACPLTDVIEEQAPGGAQGPGDGLQHQLGVDAAVGPGEHHR